MKYDYSTSLREKLTYLCAMLLPALGISTYAHGQTIDANVAIYNDTIELCSSGSTTVDFFVNGSQGSQRYAWNFDQGIPGNGTGTGPHSVSFGSNSSVTLTTTTNNGTFIRSQRIYVRMGAPVVASWNPSKTTFCSGESNYNLSGFNPTSGFFAGPGIIGKQFDPSLAGPGNHTIMFIAKDGGCSDTVTSTFTVLPSPQPKLGTNGVLSTFFGQQVYSRCAPSNANFIFTTSEIDSNYKAFQLNFGDGSPVLSGSTFPSPYVLHTYPSTGFYTVTLRMVNRLGCSHTDTIKIFFGSNPSVGLGIKGNNVKCLPNDSSGVSFTFPINNTAGNPNGTIYIVEVNDGSPPLMFNHPPPDSIVHTFYEPSCGYNSVNFQNAFQVQIRALTPCQPPSVTTVEPIYISESPTAAFNAPDRACLGEAVPIRDNSYGSLNALNGCDTTVTLVWEITPGDYILQGGALGNRMGSNNAGNWIPGTENLNALFTKPGLYTINQYIGNQAGCEIDTVSRQICVDSIPDADFGFTEDTLCTSNLDTLDFYYLGRMYTSCDTVALTWSVSPGNASIIGNPSDSAIRIVFNSARTYRVSLRAENLCGVAISNHDIVLLEAPQVSLPADYVQCGGGIVDFGQNPFNFNISGNQNASSITWQIFPTTGWNYINGTDSSSLEPVISFSSLGTYVVTVSAKNACGTAQDTMKLDFAVAPVLAPIPDTLICAGDDFNYNLSAAGGSPAYVFTWGEVTSGSSNGNGGGNPGNAGSTIFLSNITDTTQVWVIVTDINGCKDSISFSINVSDLNADAGPNQSICPGDTAYLNGSISGGLSPYQFHWSPGNMVSDSTILNPYYVGNLYSQTLSLVVTDSMGCSAIDRMTIDLDTINPANAGSDFSICLGSGTYDLHNQGTSGGTWTGPGVTGTSFDPLITGLGNFTLVYELANNTGCIFYDTVEATVLALPQAKFSLSPSGCSPLNVTAFDSSSAGVNHAWYINNSLVSTAQNPTFNLTNTGGKDSTIQIKLIISASSGCQDSIVDSVVVHPQPVGSISAPTIVCEPDSIPLVGSSSVAGSVYSWFTNDFGVSFYNAFSPNTLVDLPPNTSGFDSTYTIGLAVSANGCTDTTYSSITVGSIPQAIFQLPAAQCGPVIMNASSISVGNNLSYQWSVSAPGSIQGASRAVPTIILPNSSADSIRYRITLRVTDSITGCFDTTSRWYTVYPRPTADFTPMVTDTCGPVSVLFQNMSTSNQTGMDQTSMSFFWDFGNGQTSTDVSPTAVFSNNGVTDSLFAVTMMATNGFGCTDTLIDTIIIRPKPRSSFSVLQSTSCAPFTIDSGLINPSVFSYANENYYWEVIDRNGNVVSQDTGINTINYVINDPADTIWVRLTVTSAFGCAADTSLRMFYTLPLPNATFDFGSISGCTPFNVDILDYSTSSANKLWYVNGILAHSGNNPQFQFLNTSSTKDTIIKIKLVITSGSGCTDSTSRSLVVHPRPQASFTIPPISCASDTIYPVSSSIHSPGQPAYLWKSLSNRLIIENHTLNSPRVILPSNFTSFDSTYTIRLVLTSADGCVDSVDQNITIRPQPRAAFNIPAFSCAPVSFGPLNISAGQNLQYSWFVYPAINLQNAQGKNPIFHFPASTDSLMYNIRLIVVDSVSGCVSVTSKNFKTYPAPTADFAFSRPDSCGPFTVNFENYSSPNIAGEDIDNLQFNWDFGNGQTSTDKEPTIIFTNKTVNDIVYQVRLIITNSAGCSDTMVKNITVYPKARATASAFPTTGCAPLVIDTSNVRYVDYLEANAWYQWQIYDQANDSLLASFNRYDSLYYELRDPGDSVYLRMIAFSPFGCNNDTLIIPFHTSGKAPVDFTASTVSGCHPLAVQLNEHVGGFVQWQWYVNGQPFSTIRNPVITLTNTSSIFDSVYSISLVATDGNGCIDSTARPLRVYANREVSWYAQTGCIAEPVSFINTTTFKDSISTWYWDFDDGSSDSSIAPSHVYSSAGKYIVTLNALTIHGCEFSHTDTIIIYQNPLADFGFTTGCFGDSACVNQTISFFDSSSSTINAGQIIQWAWDVDGDGTLDYTTQNISHAFSNPGSYQVIQIVTSQYGCMDSIVKNIHIYEAPVADFVFDSIASCGPVILPVTNLSHGVIHHYQWEIFTKDSLGNRVVIGSSNSANPNPLPVFTPRYRKNTTYFVELTLSNCCGTDVHLDSVTLKPLPVSGIIADTTAGCSPLNVVFDLDSLVDGNPDFVILNYGDGNDPDTLYNWSQRTHTFLNSTLADTIYRVSLTAVNECDDSTSFIDILVKPDSLLAVMSVTPTHGCAPLEVVIMDQSVGADHVSWCPDYDVVTGNCKTALYAGDTIRYTYTTPGRYKVAQFISNDCSTDTAYTEVVVFPTPQAMFSSNANACLGDLIMFSNQTTGDTISSYTWNFGDGNSSSAINPSHIYYQPGKYQVCLQVVSINGCISSYCDTVQVFSLPEIDFWAADACLNQQPIYFYDSSSTANATFVNTYWDFGDGTSAVVNNPAHTYAAAGVYQVWLIRTNSNGCTDSAMKSIEVYPLPVPDFDPEQASGKNCGGPMLYSFKNLSSGGVGYYWDFDYNGQRGAHVTTSVDAVHLYHDPGVYDVMLVATSSYGCADTVFKTVYVRPNPEAGFLGYPQVGCAPLLVTFTDTSVYNFAGPGGIVSRSWNFGDGTSISTSDSVITHLYSEPGFYSVSLLVETDAGCMDSIYLENYVEVKETPISGFTSRNLTSNKVQFQNLSTLTDNATTYLWDFGDGNFSYEQNPTHTYNVDLFERDHEFDVCLVVTNSYGCSDTLCEVVKLKGYLLHVPNAFAPERMGVGEASIFLPKGHSLQQYHLFIYDEWGNLLWESTALNENGSPSEYWDGTHIVNGTMLPMGSYVWKIEAVFNDGTIWPGKEYNNSIRKSFGTVTLIR